jgi:hypothetical protein
MAHRLSKESSALLLLVVALAVVALAAVLALLLFPPLSHTAFPLALFFLRKARCGLLPLLLLLSREKPLAAVTVAVVVAVSVPVAVSIIVPPAPPTTVARRQAFHWSAKWLVALGFASVASRLVPP